MRKCILQLISYSLMIGLVTPALANQFEIDPLMLSGPYLGLGGSFVNVDETFNSFLQTDTTRNSAIDHYNTSRNRLAPLIQLGYWHPFCSEWLWGVVAQWKHLDYQTVNVNTSRGQYIPNATFSSINFFGPDINRDFSSQTRINNEGIFLFYVGERFNRSFIYLGLGPTILSATNSLYVSSVHIRLSPDRGDNLLSTSVNRSRTLWGPAAQIGYNYYLDPSWFLNFNYTYSHINTNTFRNAVNAGILNGRSPESTMLDVNRKINFNVQEIMISINKVFRF